ncbi:hypothetical protein AAHC03_020926 [Spirometra sp. Aus1]
MTLLLHCRSSHCDFSAKIQMADSDDDSERRRSRDKFRRERSDADSRRRPGDKREPFEDRVGGVAGGLSNSGRSRQERRDSGDYRSFAAARDRPPTSGELPAKRPRREWNDDYRPSYRHRDSRPGPVEEEVNYRPPLMPFKRFLDPLDDFITDEEAMEKYKEYKESFNKRYIEEFFEAHKNEEWLREKYHPDYVDLQREQVARNIRHRLDVFLDLFDKGMIDNQTVQMDNSDQLIKLMDAVVIKLSGGTDEDLAVLDHLDEDSGDEALSFQEPERSPEHKTSHAERSGAKSEEGEEDSDFESDDGEERKLKQDLQKAKDLLASKDAAMKADEPEQLSASQEWVGVSDNETEVPDVKKSSGTPVSESPKVVKPKSEDRPEATLNSEKTEDVTPSDAEVKEEQPESQLNVESMEAFGTTEDDDDIPTPTTAEAPEGSSASAADRVSNVESTLASVAEILGSPADDRPSTFSRQDSLKVGPPCQENQVQNKKHVRRNLHKTASVFFRCLPPTVTKKELEELCSSQPGFLRLAIYDPMPERGFTRHAWATYNPDVNIKKICWALNTCPLLRDKWQSSSRTSGELCATVNRDLAQRVRPVTPITRHKPVMRNDLMLASRLIAELDAKHNLWPLPESEKPEDEGGENASPVDVEKPQAVTNACPVPGLPGLYSANPLMRNLTDYLIDETGSEEAMLMAGAATNENNSGAAGDNEGTAESADTVAAVPIETDSSLARALDRLLIYLRIVYSVDYYSATVYQFEDSMPHRCGIFHARGDRGLTLGSQARGHGFTVTPREVTEYIQTFSAKMKPLLESPPDLTDEEIAALGARDPDKAAEDFIEANIQKRTSKKKPFKVVWVCPLSDKKFREPIFVRKHILNKHMEKVEAARKDNAVFFNNFLRDPRRPSLPEAPRHLIHQYYPPPQSQSSSDRQITGAGYGGGGHVRGRSSGGGGYRTGGGVYRGGGYRNNMGNAALLLPNQYGSRGRGPVNDYYEASAASQQMAAAAAAAAAALYPNSATADLYALAGALGGGAGVTGGGVRGGSSGRGGSPREYSGGGGRSYHGGGGEYRNGNPNNRKRPYGASDRYRPGGGGNRGVISYNDLDDPGNDGY